MAAQESICFPAEGQFRQCSSTIRRAAPTAVIDVPEAAHVRRPRSKKPAGGLSDILVSDHHGRSHPGHRRRSKASTNRAVVAPRARGGAHRPCGRNRGRGRHRAARRLAGQESSTRPAIRGPHLLFLCCRQASPLSATHCSRSAAVEVIEAIRKMMWQSLLKLRNLPDDTQFYCGHEYTDANIRFAKTIERTTRRWPRAPNSRAATCAGKPTTSGDDRS